MAHGGNGVPEASWRHEICGVWQRNGISSATIIMVESKPSGIDNLENLRRRNGAVKRQRHGDGERNQRQRAWLKGGHQAWRREENESVIWRPLRGKTSVAAAAA